MAIGDFFGGFLLTIGNHRRTIWMSGRDDHHAGETTMTSLSEMTTTQLKDVLRSLTEGLREQWRLMRTTPRETTAYAAMAESRPGLLAFRQAFDDELIARGA
jgi:hypothetical protein